MNVVNFLKRTYLTHFSKPAGRRSVYRLAHRNRLRSIVLLGIGELEFVEKLIWVCQQTAGDTLISVTGIDLFEMRPEDESPLSLKAAHQQLAATHAKVKLAPGDPFSGLSRNANSLTDTDLLIIGRNVSEDAMAPAWFYVPRMLDERSVVLRHSGIEETERYDAIPLAEVEKLADENTPRRRAA